MSIRIGGLTGATLEQMVRHPDVSQLVRQVMAETEAGAARLGQIVEPEFRIARKTEPHGAMRLPFSRHPVPGGSRRPRAESLRFHRSW